MLKPGTVLSEFVIVTVEAAAAFEANVDALDTAPPTANAPLTVSEPLTVVLPATPNVLDNVVAPVTPKVLPNDVAPEIVPVPPTLKLVVTVSEPVTVVAPVIDTGPTAVIALPAPVFDTDKVVALPAAVADIAFPPFAPAPVFEKVAVAC